MHKHITLEALCVAGAAVQWEMGPDKWGRDLLRLLMIRRDGTATFVRRDGTGYRVQRSWSQDMVEVLTIHAWGQYTPGDGPVPMAARDAAQLVVGMRHGPRVRSVWEGGPYWTVGPQRPRVPTTDTE